MENKISVHLVQLRKAKGMTQTDLSVKSGISIQTISKLENLDDDSKWPNGDTLASLAQALECSIDEIVFGSSGPVPQYLGKTDSERILISIAELVCLNAFYIHGQKGNSRGWDEDAFIEIEQMISKEDLFDFIDAIRELNSVKKKRPESGDEIDKMIRKTIADYSAKIMVAGR